MVHALRAPPRGPTARPRVARATATPARPRLIAYRGLGAWIDIYDRAKWRRPRRTVARLDRRVRTIFLQTADYGSRGPIKFPRRAARFLPLAHARNGRGAHRYIARSAHLIRSKTGRPRVPIHMIGGLAEVARPAEVRGFVRAVRRSRVIGASLYDADTTGRRHWAILERIPKATAVSP